MNQHYVAKKKDYLHYRVECPNCQAIHTIMGVRDFRCVECDELVKKETVDFVLPYTIEQAETSEEIATIVLDNLLCGKYDTRYIGFDKVSGLFYSTSYFDDGGKILHAMNAEEAGDMLKSYWGEMDYAAGNLALLIERAM